MVELKLTLMSHRCYESSRMCPEKTVEIGKCPSLQETYRGGTGISVVATPGQQRKSYDVHAQNKQSQQSSAPKVNTVLVK
ncbi:hypothetical protein TRAPUB_6541 [Trametes pubescens]|uniref:Uncharacterized protein n=1 Tax=Trametes pubescens TaxID=154538 RepID=A0A1M2V5L2_TRAPU|nr:hypothetical protein TRAPUB_6541 [Trametes pubescens]